MVLATPLIAKENVKPPRLFSDTTEMKVTLSGPWRTLRNSRKKDALYPIQMTYNGADGKQHTLDAEVAPRGITRRQSICEFPPLKIHFDKEKIKDTEFRGNKSLKLVTYCKTDNKYEQYYVKEFLIYRIFNLITEYSFRVRPMTVGYKDSQVPRYSIPYDFDSTGLVDAHYAHAPAVLKLRNVRQIVPWLLSCQ